MSQTIIPSKWEQTSAWVYAPTGKRGSIPVERHKIQGVWTAPYSANDPQEVWLFKEDQKPKQIADKHKHGVWGYRPGVSYRDREPEDLWFYPPNARIPANFEPQGVWLFPLVHLKDEIEKIRPGKAGFLKVGTHVEKDENLDVGGQWNMIYRRDPNEERKARARSIPVPPPEPKMRINVLTPEGTKLRFDVKPTDTIDSVKSKVKGETNIPKHEQILVFGKKVLQDDPCLEDYGIKDGDTLRLEPMEINVRDSKGNEFPIPVKPTDTIANVKKKIEKKTGIPKDEQRLAFKGEDLDDSPTLKDYNIKHKSTLDLGGMQIRVKDLNRDIHTLDVTKTDTIDSIKKKIKQKTGIPKDEQRVTFKGKELKNPNKTLDDYNIRDGDLLNLEPMQVFVTDPNTNKMVPIDVSPNDDIDKVKDKIERKIGIPKEDQRLTLDGDPLDDPDKTLKDYDVKHGDLLSLDPMKIHVREPNGKKTTFMVKPTDTVDSIKDKIEKKRRIPKEDQRLTFDGRDLKDKPTLKHYGIQHDDVLDLAPMQVKVRDPDGKLHTVDVTSTDDIDTVKKKIEEITRIPTDEQLLSHDGEPLDDPDKTLKDYDVVHGDILDLEQMQVQVRDPDGRLHPINVKPTDDIDTLKRKIEKETRIPKKDQRLTFDGEELDDPDKTLKDYDIRHRDIITIEKMVINVKEPNGRTFPLDVNPRDTVDDIKDLIEQKRRIPKDEQRLSFREKDLKDNQTLEYYKVKNGDTLVLGSMQVKVRDPDGKVHTVDVSPNDDIDTVKDKIEDETGIPKDTQLLSSNGEPLDDPDKTLKDYGVDHGDTIDVEPMQVRVKDPDGRLHPIDVSPNDDIDKVMDKIEEKTGIPKDEQRLTFEGEPLDDPDKTLQDYDVQHRDILVLEPMQVIVKEPNGNTFPVNVNPNETIDDVKNKIKQKTKISKKEQRLVFRNKELEDRRTIKEYRIRHQDVLELAPMQVKVKDPDGRVHTIDVAPDDKIDDVKDKIEDQTGIPKDKQRLSLDGEPLDNPKKTLKDYGVRHGDMLNLDSMVIHVREPNGRTFDVDVDPTDTIDDVKKKIKYQEGIPLEEQRLAFGGEELDDPRRTLRDYGIEHDDTVDLEPMEVRVKEPNGSIFTLEVTPRDTVDDIKNKIKKKRGIPKEEQRLAHRGKDLNDPKKTLKSLKITHGDLIDLGAMQINVNSKHVFHGKGKVFTIDVSPDDTFDTIRRKIKKAEGIPEDDQRIFYANEPVEDRKTLDDYNIKHGGTINLEPMEIFIQPWNGETYVLPVSAYDKIDKVKGYIHYRKGVPKKHQLLIHGDTVLYEDDKTLKEYNVRHKNTLILERMKITIRDQNGKTFTLIVSPSDTIDHVKAQIEDEEKIPKKDQILKFKGNKLDDGPTLRDYKIPHLGTLDLEIQLYQIEMTEWLNPMMGYNPKPRVKHEGKRDLSNLYEYLKEEK